MAKATYKVWLEIYKIPRQNIENEIYRYDGPIHAFETNNLERAKSFAETIVSVNSFFVGHSKPPANKPGATHHVIRIEIEIYEESRDKYKTIVQVDLSASRSFKALSDLRDKLQTVARSIAENLPE